MKNIFPRKLIAGAVAFVLMFTLFTPHFAQASSTVVRFDPAAASPAVNDTFTVKVQIDNVTNLKGVECHITYNPAILEVQDAAPNSDGVQIALGPFLYPEFVALNTVDPGQGKIDFSYLHTQRSAVSGSGAVATITFRAKASGTAALTFSDVKLADANALQISAATQNGQVQVGGVSNPTPTPVPGQPTPTPKPNYPTPTPIPGNPTPVPGAGILGYHTVRAHETLFCIGRAYAVLPWAIATQNSVSYPYNLRVGQVLAIPNVAWPRISAGPICARQFGDGTTPVPTSPAPTPSPAGCRATHIVQRGETLSTIARRYATTVWSIAAANNIANPNLIFPGQALCIK